MSGPGLAALLSPGCAGGFSLVTVHAVPLLLLQPHVSPEQQEDVTAPSYPVDVGHGVFCQLELLMDPLPELSLGWVS